MLLKIDASLIDSLYFFRMFNPKIEAVDIEIPDGLNKIMQLESLGKGGVKVTFPDKAGSMLSRMN